MKAELRKIIDKDLRKMDAVEWCIWHSTTGTSLGDTDAAADLRAGWLAEIERLEQRVKELQDQIEIAKAIEGRKYGGSESGE